MIQSKIWFQVWTVAGYGQLQSFVMAEHYFHQLHVPVAPKVASQGIDIVTITIKATSDSDVLSTV